MREVCSKCWDKILANKVAIYICVAIVLFSVKALWILYVVPHDSEIVNEMISLGTVVATALLVSGVFGSVSKVELFRDIYKDVLVDVLYGKKYLDDASEKSPGHLVDVWKNVSVAIYKNKFPLLSDRIHEHILSKYLPAKHNFYYKNYRCILSYKIVNEKYIEETYETSFTVMDIDREAPLYHFTSRFYYDGNDKENVKSEIKSFSIDGKSYSVVDVDEKDISSTERVPGFLYLSRKHGNDEKSQKLTHSNKGECVISQYQTCNISRVLREVKPFIPINKSRLVTFSRFVDGLIVIAKYPEKDFAVDFCSVALDDKQMHEDIQSRPGFIYQEYRGVVFPGQGFLITVDRAEG